MTDKEALKEALKGLIKALEEEHTNGKKPRRSPFLSAKIAGAKNLLKTIND